MTLLVSLLLLFLREVGNCDDIGGGVAVWLFVCLFFVCCC